MTMISGMFHPRSSLAKRNMQVVLLRSKGTIYRIIGVEFDITGKRAAQIYDQHRHTMSAPEDSDFAKQYRQMWQDVMGVEPPKPKLEWD